MELQYFTVLILIPYFAASIVHGVIMSGVTKSKKLQKQTDSVGLSQCSVPHHSPGPKSLCVHVHYTITNLVPNRILHVVYVVF